MMGFLLASTYMMIRRFTLALALAAPIAAYGAVAATKPVAAHSGKAVAPAPAPAAARLQAKPRPIANKAGNPVVNNMASKPNHGTASIGGASYHAPAHALDGAAIGSSKKKGAG